MGTAVPTVRPALYGWPVLVAVLVSGSGTNLDAMLEAGVPVALVVSDRPLEVEAEVIRENDLPAGPNIG